MTTNSARIEELQQQLEEAKFRLECARTIENLQKNEIETRRYRERIKQIEAEIEALGSAA